MGDKRNGKLILYMVSLVVLAAALALFAFLLHGRRRGAAAESVVIAVPYSEWVQDYETNYYTRWLEEKTGYAIDFVYLDESYERESLNLMLTSENSGVDAVFFPSDQEILSLREYRDYAEGGYLAAPGDYLSDENKLAAVKEAYPEVDFDRLAGGDDKLYCFPSLRLARADRNLQVLWINIDWLTGLGLTMPRTAEEFRETLEAFREGDPNGNGIKDEIPLISCGAETSLQSYIYLINAFTYYDGSRLSRFGEEGAEAEAFREGVAYCARLYDRGLLACGAFPATTKQMMELVNDPADLVGAFASHSIADVVYANNPDILAHFVQLAPLSSEVLEQGYAVSAEVFAGVGGIIPANAPHKTAAAEIMDVMLSEEASLIALYGEEGIDWRFSGDGELSTYGTHARVTTIRYIKGERQNKNYGGAGPLLAASEYMDGVTWNGDHSMMEYIDARAVKAYEAYYRIPPRGDNGGSAPKVPGAADTDSGIREYLETEVTRFIMGERDVKNDRDWEEFLDNYRKLLPLSNTED